MRFASSGSGRSRVCHVTEGKYKTADWHANRTNCNFDPKEIFILCLFLKKNEMSRDMTKTSKWPPSLIRVFPVRMKKAWVLSYTLSAQRRLCGIWVFAGRTATLLVLTCRGSNKVSFRIIWKTKPFWATLNNAKLTHNCLVDPSILINWTSPFPILGVSGVIFHFILFRIEIPVSKQWRPWSGAAFCGIWSGFALFA